MEKQLLYDDEFKSQFFRVFIYYYPTLLDHMITIKDNEEKRVMDDYINRVTAQVFISIFSSKLLMLIIFCFFFFESCGMYTTNYLNYRKMMLI